MKIGVISDTHGRLDPSIFEHFSDCDEIWHAGDIGDPGIISELAGFKELKTVYGNIDNHEIRQISEEDLIFEVEGIKVLITHIAGKPPKYNTRVRQIIQDAKPGIVVCGHSHILKVEYDKNNNLLFINPGAAGFQGFHRIRTILKFQIDDGRPSDMLVVELGKR